jgi:hypothetical protein
MNKNTRNLLIAGGVVVVGFLVYRQMQAAKQRKALSAAAGTATTDTPSTGFGTNTGSDFWSAIFG